MLRDLKNVQWEVIPAGPFEFRLAFRKIGDDRGPTLEVYGQDEGEWKEVLKFDAFEKRPHWHRCHPVEKDEIIFTDPTGFEAQLDFAGGQLRDHFGRLLEEQ